MASYQHVRRLIQEEMVDAIEGGDIDQILKDLDRAANRMVEP